MKEKTILETPEIQSIEKGKNSSWYPPGVSGNPNGRPKRGSLETMFREAMEEVKKRHNGKDIIHHFVERAYKSDTVLICVMKKLIADKIHVDGDGTGGVQLYVVFNGSETPGLIKRIQSQNNKPETVSE